MTDERCFVFTSNSETSTNLQSPATAPSSASFMGDFGNRLFEPSDFFGEFPIAAHEAEQHRKQAVGGSLLFGYFFLAKQEKVSRLSRESDNYCG
jgi:hypothetical protein